MTDFNGRVAVITGGANGMGEAVAHTFARAGATVVVIDRDTERTPLVEAAIREAGGKVATYIADVGDEDQVRSTIDQIVKDHGRIDVLDNNAAALELASDDLAIADLEMSVFFDTIRGSLMPNLLVTKYALPTMLDQGSGSIINMASVSGMLGELTLSAYGIAKAGVIQLTKATAVQYSRSGIRCNAIAPAYVTTRNNLAYAPKEMMDIYDRSLLTPEPIAPQNIADAVFFLGSDESAKITGQVLPVDGGISSASPIVADIRDYLGAGASGASR